MKKILASIAALALAASAVVAVNMSATGAETLVFESKFDTATEFTSNYDYGFSGMDITRIDDSIKTWGGDHANMSGDCMGPETTRTVGPTGSDPNMDFSSLFYWCGPSAMMPNMNGHLMTSFTTKGYNHIWFSPKQEFTGITKVCYDSNETFIGGEWQEVQFVDHADATRYPAGMNTSEAWNNLSMARGTGGFDLGYTDPGFRENDPNDRIFPGQPETLVGLQDLNGSGVLNWFQGGDFTTMFAGWPGISGASSPNPPITDEATRYKHCIENMPNNQVKVTLAAPGRDFNTNPRVETLTGQIPQDARRVVFHHAGYDPPKRGGYDPEHLTWHWDNIQVFTAAGSPLPSTTTTVAPSTTTTTVVPSTTTTVAPSTTTTVPPSTTTTVPVPPFKLPIFATDPANPQPGMMWINSTTNQVKVRLPNGVTRVLRFA